MLKVLMLKKLATKRKSLKEEVEKEEGKEEKGEGENKKRRMNEEVKCLGDINEKIRKECKRLGLKEKMKMKKSGKGETARSGELEQQNRKILKVAERRKFEEKTEVKMNTSGEGKTMERGQVQQHKGLKEVGSTKSEEKTEIKTSGKVEPVEQQIVKELIKAFKCLSICSTESKKTKKQYNIVGAKRRSSEVEEIDTIFRKLRVVGEVREEAKFVGVPGHFP